MVLEVIDLQVVVLALVLLPQQVPSQLPGHDLLLLVHLLHLRAELRHRSLDVLQLVVLVLRGRQLDLLVELCQLLLGLLQCGTALADVAAEAAGPAAQLQVLLVLLVVGDAGAFEGGSESVLALLDLLEVLLDAAVDD